MKQLLFGSVVFSTRRPLPAWLLSLLAVSLMAQVSQPKIDAVYQCAAGQSFKVISCAGKRNADLCDVQSYVNGQPSVLGKSPYPRVAALASTCHLQTAAEAKAQERGASVAQSGAGAAAGQEAGVGGFKVGDTVQVSTAFGWMNAQILRVNGNNYYVHAQSGGEAWKSYPGELRRIGKLNDIDRANGLYEPGERVQVNIGGQWINGKVETELNQEYQIVTTDNRSVWTKAANLRRVAGSAQPEAPKAGTPPKPGFTSCAGKIEGRYSNSGGFGSLTLIFRSGKATIPSQFGGGEDTFECWVSGDKIILHKPGESANTDMPIDINNDGSLDTPLGEIKKKGN